MAECVGRENNGKECLPGSAAALDLCSPHRQQLPTTRLVYGNCVTVAAPRHGAAAPHRAVMGIKRHPVENPVEHACGAAPHAQLDQLLGSRQ